MALSTREKLAFWAEELEEDLIQFDGLEDAVVGVAQVHTQPSRIVYSFDKIIEILMDDGMTEDDAIEYFEFNIACLWAGENTPTILYSISD